MKGCIFNVGPINNSYAGPHTYADVLFPFVKELCKRGIDLTWIGITLKNRVVHPRLSELRIFPNMPNLMSIENDVTLMSQSWDFIDATKFDFFLSLLLIISSLFAKIKL